MIKKILILTCLFLCEDIPAQLKQQDLFSLQSNSENNLLYFTYNNKSLYFNEDYLFSLEISDTIDKLKLIRNLLEFEGDNRILKISPQTIHNPLSSRHYTGELKSCSVQVYALFLINYIYYDNFWYSSFPVLINKWTKNEQAIEGLMVRKVFKKYKRWYKRISKERNFSNKLSPLKGSFIRWY
jgi:hypothetical protein